MTLVALDVGSRWVGIARTDETNTIVIPVDSFDRQRSGARQKLVELLIRLSPEALIVGVPTDREGKPGHQAKPIQRFARQIASATGLPVQFVDESHTTMLANQHLAESGSRHRVDTIAAAIILEGYLAEMNVKSGVGARQTTDAHQEMPTEI